MLKLMRYLRPYKISIAVVLFLIMVQSFSELYLPTLMADIVDTGIMNQDIPFIWKIGGVMLLVAALGTICSIGVSYYSAKVSMSFGKELRYKVFSHVENFSLQEFDQIGTSSLITRTIKILVKKETSTSLAFHNLCSSLFFVAILWISEGSLFRGLPYYI